MTSRSGQSPTWADASVAEIYRTDWGRLLSLLIARTRRLDLAEDALGEAFVRASERWPAAGVPANPAAWLYTTASRVILGQLRSEAVHGRKAALLAVRTDWVQRTVTGDIDDLDDERLALILLCCHPALRPSSRSSLALRLVIGTTTEDIARLFVVPKSTMAARITRAKKKIIAAGIPLAAPIETELRTRLDDVCRTIYLAFTAAYAPASGPDLLRADLAGEAVELAAVLRPLAPTAHQVQALYGLLLLQHARRDARVRNGRLVTLADQDRSLWHHDLIRTGTELVSRVPAGTGYAEELRLQGLIAAEHTNAPKASDTRWSTIATLYARLETLTGSPIVRLNRAVAVGESQGPGRGLDLIDGLDDALARNPRLHAVRADLARRAGNVRLARTSYQAAIALCTNEVEQQYLADRFSTLDSTVDPPNP